MSDINKNISPFDGTKYGIWKSRIRALIDESILDANALSIVDSDHRLESVSETEWLRRNKIAKGIIIRNLNDSIVGYATKDPSLTACQIFAKLDSLYMRQSMATELSLEMKLSNFKYVDGKLSNHFMEFDDLIADMEAASGEKTREVYKIGRLLSSLPKSYGPLVIAIQTLSDENLSLEFVKVRLLDYEVQLNKELNEAPTKVLLTKTNNEVKHNNTENKFKNNRSQNKIKFRKPFNKINKVQKQQYTNKRFNKYKHNKFKCDHCGRSGHKIENCFYYNRSENNRIIQTNTAFVDQNQHFAFMTNSENKDMYETNNENKINFILDSGATDHLAKDINIFSTIVELENPITINVAKLNQIIIETKKGTINITTNKGFQGTIKDVLYVPDLTFNLLSVTKLQQAGMCIIFAEDGSVMVKNKNKIIIFGKKNTNLICVEFFIRKKICNNTIANHNKYKLWHERLGHISNFKFLLLKSNNLIEDTKNLSTIYPIEYVCEACQYGKQSRLPFNKQRNRDHVNRPLFVIHTDVCGPIKPSTFDDTQQTIHKRNSTELENKLIINIFLQPFTSILMID